MAILAFPFFFVNEEDADKAQLCGKEPQPREGVLNINTTQVVSYHEGQVDDTTVVNMSNGDTYILPIGTDYYEDLLSDSEIIIDLANVGEN